EPLPEPRGGCAGRTPLLKALWAAEISAAQRAFSSVDEGGGAAGGRADGLAARLRRVGGGCGAGCGRQGVEDAADGGVVVRGGEEPRLEDRGRQGHAGVEHRVEEGREAEGVLRLDLRVAPHRRSS